MKINMSHGNGALETSELIDSVFMKSFRNKWNENMEDAALLDIATPGSKLAFTTDSFVVKPLFFPGGDIGRLAVCGTVNDILTTGAKPLFLSASFIIEEGMDTETLSDIASSMREAADEAAVHIVTGDTKVIEGSGGVYINTSGVGLTGNDYITVRSAKPSDAIIVTGTLGDHHACIMSSRMGISNSVRSDAAPLTDIVRSLQSNKIPVHGMRDITRGGLAGVLNEIVQATRLKAVIDEASLPVSETVKGLCDILGLDPLYMANEGKMLIITPDPQSALAIIRAAKYGQNANIIGYLLDVESNDDACVVQRTIPGGYRLVPPLSGEGLPRIC